MLWIVLGFAILKSSGCLLGLILPQFLRKILNFVSIGSRLYVISLLRISIGILLLFLAAQSRLWGYVVAIGMITTGSGLSLFFFALRRTKKLLARIQNQPDHLLRLLLIAGLAIWALLIFALLP